MGGGFYKYSTKVQNTKKHVQPHKLFVHPVAFKNPAGQGGSARRLPSQKHRRVTRYGIKCAYSKLHRICIFQTGLKPLYFLRVVTTSFCACMSSYKLKSTQFSLTRLTIT